jgi:peptidoglycan-N-acetylglucosamine deacetylase
MEAAVRHPRRRFSVFQALPRRPMSPDQQLRLVLSRIEQAGRGIVLFHDTKAQTARMLPAFLRELKRRGFHVVHVIPAKTDGKPP